MNRTALLLMLVASQALASPPWLSEFPDPLSAWRPQIFFVTNGSLNRERTTGVLRQYKDRGIGGVFFHCRPGLIKKYLSDEFLAQWDWALTECKRLGMECHIYDENALPSSFSSGGCAPPIRHWGRSTSHRRRSPGRLRRRTKARWRISRGWTRAS